MLFWFIGVFDIAVAAAVALIAWRHAQLTLPGAAAAVALSVLLYAAGGTAFLAAMLVFFLSSSLLTGYRNRDKHAIEEEAHARPGARGIVQVAANGGAAAVMAILFLATKNDAAVVGFFAAFAACNADTWASELGELSRTRPVSILSRRPVQAGLSGGVTPLGFAASLCGGVLIAGVYFVFFLLRRGWITVADCAVIAAAGFAGSVLDSVLGDAVQAKYRIQDSARFTEKPGWDGKANSLAKGLRFVTNDVVNVMSSAVACAAAYLLAALLRL